MAQTSWDILQELKELSQDMAQSIRHSLSYYKASVYKDEMTEQIEEQIKQLQWVLGLFHEPVLQEPFFDYEAMRGTMQARQGECPFSQRVLHLLESLEQAFLAVDLKNAPLAKDLHKKITYQKQKLLSICHVDSRQFHFFQAL